MGAEVEKEPAYDLNELRKRLRRFIDDPYSEENFKVWFNFAIQLSLTQPSVVYHVFRIVDGYFRDEKEGVISKQELKDKLECLAFPPE